MNKKNDNALILFTKAPRMGTVKTRLQPELTPVQALQLYRAMVEDTVHRIDNPDLCDLKIFFNPSDAIVEMKNWLGDVHEYFPQEGKNLGEKMYRAIAEVLEKNYKKVAVVGSDIPGLDSSTLVQAFEALDEYDVILGPVDDGGYYLIGMKQAYSGLFEKISWSTGVVLQQTLHRARKSGLKTFLLPQKSDLDTYSDLMELWNLLNKQNFKDRNEVQSETYRVLELIFTTIGEKLQSE